MLDAFGGLADSCHRRQPTDMDRLFTPDEMSELLGVKLSTIYQWTHIEYIPHFKLGRFVRFREQEILKWLESKSRNGRNSQRPNINL